MNTPEGAILEADLGDGIALYDVAKLLPRAKKKLPYRKRYRKRDPKAVGFVIVHKSGADGPPGFRGMEGSARFVVNHRGWQGFAYTFWFPRVPDVDPAGRLVVYRGQPDDVRSFHTGGRMNTIGVGFGVQGNYDGDADGVIEREPTEFQLRALEKMARYAEGRYPAFSITGRADDADAWRLSGHWEHGKPVCPGDALVAWVRRMRGEGGAMVDDDELGPQGLEVDPKRFTKSERQKALALLGYDPGPIDGIWGYRSRAALETFQAAEGLVVDGAWGRHSAAAMLRALRKTGFASRAMFDSAG